MQFTIIKSQRKTLCISINKEAEILVKAPKNLSKEYISKFVNTKKNWIEKKIIKIKNVKIHSENLRNQNLICIFGKVYNTQTDKHFKILENTLFYPEKYQIFTDSKFLYKFLDQLLNSKLEKYLQIYTEKMNLESEFSFEKRKQKTNLIFDSNSDKYYLKIVLKKLKSKWGSCFYTQKNPKNIRLTFNSKLIHFPEIILEYLVVHELSHIYHPNHLGKFWNLVESLFPAYKEAEKWLKSESNKWVFDKS
jgi:predicted metal-dependent hydrolase